MRKKNMKKFAAMSLVVAMSFGSALTAFADDTATSGTTDGTGTYEGGEMKYPAIKVTLPTVPAGAFNYIADPNGLISDTNAAAHTGFTFTGNTGVFFKTTSSTYTDKSEAMEITNQSAQAVDVTVKLTQKTAGSDIIQYSDSATFTDATDKANKLYLAVTDGATTSPKTAALSATGEAAIKVTLAGAPDNYEKKWDETNKYHYAMIASPDANKWQKTSFLMTGALNPNATWGDSVTFPEITLTWNVVEHKDSYLDKTTVTQTANEITVNDGITVTKVTLIKKDTTAEIALTAYTFADGKLTFPTAMLSKNVGGTLKVTLSNGTTEDVLIQ